MSGVLWGEALACEYMPQVTITVGTNNFYTSTIGIRIAPHSTTYLFVKTGPSATRSELVF